MGKKNKLIEGIIVSILVLYSIIAAVVIIYVVFDLEKSKFNNTHSTLYRTLEYLIIPILILVWFLLLNVLHSIADKFK